MSLRIGIVGLPNVGKSTLFNALTSTDAAAVGNFPFTTVDPNVGVVAVPEPRLEKISAVVQPAKVTPATVEFVDIAGLVKGAHKGEGLGNQFLGHIREVDAIALVVRRFKNPNITHVAGAIDPEQDRKTILTELILADLQTLEKYWKAVEKLQKTGENVQPLINALQKIEAELNQEHPARAATFTSEEQAALKPYPLLTLRPILTVYNVDERDLKSAAPSADAVTISAALEKELLELTPQDQAAYLKEIGMEGSGLARLIQTAYRLLGYASFFTAGEKEVRAWKITQGTTAPEAAGEIHTDFARQFIRAEVVPWETFVQYKGWRECKAKGLVKSEGKTYVVQDGDVILFQTGT